MHAYAPLFLPTCLLCRWAVAHLLDSDCQCTQRVQCIGGSQEYDLATEVALAGWDINDGGQYCLEDGYLTRHPPAMSPRMEQLVQQEEEERQAQLGAKQHLMPLGRAVGGAGQGG